MNGALGHDSFALTGGDPAGGDGAGMAQAPNSAANQSTISFTLNSSAGAATLVHLESDDGAAY